MARLLLAATNRELQRVIGEEVWFENSDRRSYWGSLLTMKWVIVRFDKEHRRYRRLAGNEGVDNRQLDGVDYDAVARSSGRWMDIKTERQTSNDEVYQHLAELEVH